MSTDRRLQRFRRLAGLDQRKLERAAAELLAANEALQLAVARLEGLRSEYAVTLAACARDDLAQRRQTTIWADWSIREQQAAESDVETKTGAVAKKRQAVLQARMRTEAWSRLIARLARQRQVVLNRRDLAQADELAVRQHWLGQRISPADLDHNIEPGAMPSDRLADSLRESTGQNELELYP